MEGFIYQKALFRNHALLYVTMSVCHSDIAMGKMTSEDVAEVHWMNSRFRPTYLNKYQFKIESINELNAFCINIFSIKEYYVCDNFFVYASWEKF